MTTSPAPIPHRHARHPLVLVSLIVLAFAAATVGIVVAARHTGTSSTFSSGVKGSGVPATQARTLAAFTAVDLAGSNNVTVHVGDTQTVTVRGDDNLIRYVTTTVQDGTLAVGQSRNFSTTSPMSVVITVPALDAATLSGAGVLTVTGVAADHFTVRAPGSGVLVVTGTATTLDATLSGTGDVRLDGLAAHDATATVSGTGRLLVNASHSLDATVSGVGSILYTGNPTTVTKNVTGTGSITGSQG
ncbi:MAG: head GIN domain-containing protein [Acidimicrobiia bacterium]